MGESVFALTLSLLLGSFATVLISRLPKGDSIRGRSRCPACGNRVLGRHNVPLLGFFWLRGRCHACRSRISIMYPLIEIATFLMAAVLIVGSAGFFLKVATTVFVAFGLALSVIDYQVRRLPNALVFWLTIILLSLIVLDAQGDFTSLGRAVAWAIAYTSFLGLLRVISGGGMGMGDVKFAFPLGLITGYLSSEAFAVGVALAFILGAVIGLILMSLGKASRKTAMPFGPFLFLGAYLAWVLSGYGAI